MIPLSLTLRGFLSFRDEETLRFEHDCVQLLSGPNGTGKSSVFDAIVFALFGVHRGGSQDKGHLINKQSDTASVEFDFRMNGRSYRAERGLRRKTDRFGEEKVESTRQLYVQDGGNWKPVPGTNRDAGFSEQLEDRILGLSAEAFLSSVLLMQGRAEDLIEQDAKAAEHRFNTLKKLVGLEYYENLHDKVDTVYKVEKTRVENLEGQLSAIPPVGAEEFAELDRLLKEKEAELESARQEIAALEQRKERAAEWTRLQTEIAGLMERQRKDAALLQDAERIKADIERLNELERVLPQLSRLIELRVRQAECMRQLKLHDAEREKLAPQLAALDDQRRKLHSRHAEGRCEQEKRDEERTRLQNHERQLERALPRLCKLHDSRGELKTATEELSGLEADKAKTEAECASLEMESKKLAAELADADAKLNQAKHDASVAQAQVEAEKERQKRFASVSGKKNCSYCGQKMTAEHVKKEINEIEKQLAECQNELEEAAAKRDQLDAARGKLVKKHQETDGKRQDGRRRFDLLGQRSQQKENEIQRLTSTLRGAYDELEPALQAKVSAEPPKDWLKTTFPTADDLRKCKAEIDADQTRIKELDVATADWKNELAKLTAQESRLEEDAKTLQPKQNSLATAIAAEEKTLNIAKTDEAAPLAALPDEWQPKAATMDGDQLVRIRGEHQSLASGGAKERWQELQQASSRGDELKQRLAKAREQDAGFTENTRCSPEIVSAELAKSRDYERELQKASVQFAEDRRRLDERRNRRITLEQEFFAAQRKQKHAKRLADLLGPKQLQRHLLHQAEVGIVDNANRILDRLSGGQIALRLQPEDENEKSRALQLIAHKPADGKTYLLTYLSGSEKFRIAISLALGIGQYASRLQKPLEAVIIDEGFGCLDRENRDAIIEEIDQLRGQLKCIVLVSHQEEFAQVFPRGYRFRKEDGTTRVEPLAV